MNNKVRKIQLITAILGAIFALGTFVALFLPAFRHQKPDNANIGLGNFKVVDVISGGLYDYEHDKKDETTGYLIKYEKLSLGAQNYFEKFVLLGDADNRYGSIFAVSLGLTMICALLMFVSSLVTIGAGSDAFWLQLIIGVLHLIFTVVAMLLISPLSALVGNEIFENSNFTLVMGIAPIVLLISAVGFITCILLGRVLSLKRNVNEKN